MSQEIIFHRSLLTGCYNVPKDNQPFPPWTARVACSSKQPLTRHWAIVSELSPTRHQAIVNELLPLTSLSSFFTSRPFSPMWYHTQAAWVYLHLSLSFWSAMASSRATDFGFLSWFPFSLSQSAGLNLHTSESLVVGWPPSLSFISNSEKRIIAR